MNDYLARLVRRAQNLAPGDIASSDAAPREADIGLDDPFDTVGEPEPPAWPATRSTPPSPFAAPRVERADAAALPPLADTTPASASPFAAEVPPPAPTEPRTFGPPTIDAPSPTHAEPVGSPESRDRAAEPTPPAPPAPPSAPLSIADAFMANLMPPSAPVEPQVGPTPAPTPGADDDSEPREAAVGHAEPAQPTERLTARTPPPATVFANLDAPPSPEPSEPEPRLSIGRLTVTVEPPPPRQEVTVTRIVRAAPANASRAARPRTRFGLAQS